MYKIIKNILIILFPILSYSQLTVLNPGLEGTPGDCFVTPTPWENCMPYTNFITGAVEFTTPDTQPGCYNITLAPSEGDSYIGFGHIPDYNLVNPYVGATEWQEGFSQELSSPMESNGCPYIFTIDLANGLTADPWNGTNIATTIGEVKVFGGFDFCSEEELLWSSGPITNENWETYTVEFTPTANYSHILFQCEKTEENAICAYVLADNITPIINSAPNADAGSNQELCEDFTNLNGNILENGQSGSWSIISGNAIFQDPTDPNTMVSELNIGENIFEWIVSAECTDETGNDQVIINVIPAPTSNAGNNQELCENFTNLNANSPQIGETGFWNIVAGNGDFQNPNNPNTIVTNLSSGNNIFEWTINSELCGSFSDAVNITYIESDLSSNAGENQILCENSTYLNGNIPNDNEFGTWSVVSGNANFEDVNNPNTFINGLSIGNNILEWTISDPCESTSSQIIITVEILDVNIDSYSDYNGYNISCSNANDGYININTSGGYPPYNYTWIGPNNFNSNTEDIVNLPPGLYECFLIDATGCEEFISIDLTAPNPIEMELIGLEDQNCNNNAHINFNAIGGAGLVNFSVNTSWGEFYNTNSTNPMLIQDFYLDFNNFSQWEGLINIIAIDENGCEASLTDIAVQTWDNPISDFSMSSDNIIISEMIMFTDNSYSDSPIINWSWDFGDGNTSNEQNPSHLYQTENQYTICLRIEDENGCEDEKCKIINIYNNTQSYIPNIFTVNNDGINDEFLPVVYGIQENTYELLIYDRWGKLMFSTNNHKKGWNGTYDGKIVTQDVYSYIVSYLTISGEEKQHVGKITLAK